MNQKSQHQSGVALTEALVALIILAFGLLGLASLQTRVTREATDAQTRVLASRVGDELLSMAQVDRGNAGCYVLPTATNCASTVASSAATAWRTQALQTLPTGATASSVLSSSRLTIEITWPDRAAGETRTLRMTTGVAQ